MADRDLIEEAVRAHYAEAASVACCGENAAAVCGDVAVYGASRYDERELAGLPAEVVAASIGCANPVAVADLHAGEVVLDLGSGGGIDVLLSARRVGPTGHAFGVDMTDEMLELARANQAQAGVENVTFVKGTIDAVPLPDASVDVVISNCVVNLAADKAAVLCEAARLLRPGGRFAVADVVADGEIDPALRGDLTAWADCLAGALTRDEYRALLVGAGFNAVTIEDSHLVAEGFTSAIVRATKPSDG